MVLAVFFPQDNGLVALRTLVKTYITAVPSLRGVVTNNVTWKSFKYLSIKHQKANEYFYQRA